ncbi:MAG TPA: TatD family hydrolase [Candidatus Choladousia intestinavium]|uniref:TatD family hydrolase n=1 Tax=Candidatus Choladousia intestinavium TaxID=2840727 RepID=A0A9D1AC53_9FIRM|nr:TatD family hydrolase [Candidatus Choladousia intestinavium]
MKTLEERLRQTRMIDMHAHFSCLEEGWEKLRRTERMQLGEQELRVRGENRILTCFSGGRPGEWELLEEFSGREEVLLSFGIHPWYADRYEAEDYRETFEKCRILGEIGMDSVWCRVPLPVQEKQFKKQLRIAADLKKPVLLHTKGAERRIAELVKDFPGRICVHWYSGEEKELELFLEKDCYFTLGPDTSALCKREEAALSGEEQVRRRMLQEIPANRLFVETDGIGAVAWAMGKERMELEEIPGVLGQNLACTAKWKRLSEKEMEEQMKKNLLEFLKK